MTNKLKVLIGIEENYTSAKIIDCFKHRDQYQVSLFDPNQANTADVYWLEYEDLDFENLIKSSSLLNSYCIRKGIFRKRRKKKNRFL